MWYKWKIITKMNKSDIWRMVTYIDIWGCEDWKIKSFNNETQTAFVVYKCNNNWLMYEQYTAQATKYSDLEFNN